MMNILNQAQKVYSHFSAVKTENEFVSWLRFANPGMLNDGNIHLMEIAISNLPTNDPIVEIGSFCGLSTNLITYFLNKYSKSNKLITCDKWIFEGSETEEFLGDSKISHAGYKQFVKESYIRNIKFFSGDRLPYTFEKFSDEFFDDWAQKKVGTDVLGRDFTLGGPLSFAYIDGNHTYQWAKHDFDCVDKFLVKGGYVLFDDSAKFFGHECGRFMDDVLKNPNYELVKRNPNYLFQKI